MPRSKNEWSYTSTRPIYLHSVVLRLKKVQRQLYLYLLNTSSHCYYQTTDVVHRLLKAHYLATYFRCNVIMANALWYGLWPCLGNLKLGIHILDRTRHRVRWKVWECHDDDSCRSLLSYDVTYCYGLHIWRATANIINRQSRTVDIAWSSNLGVAWGVKTSHLKKIPCHETLHRAIVWEDKPEWFLGKGWKSVDWIHLALAQDRDKWRARKRGKEPSSSIKGGKFFD
jgi:hypothetical protein